MPTTVSDDFAQRQERYTTSRRFIRDVLLRGIAFHLLVRVEVNGQEHIPASEPTILIFNHINGIDPAIILGVVGPRFVVAMSKIENFRVPVVGWLMRWWGMFPVRRGEVDRTALQNAVNLLKAGNIVLMAPEGTREPKLSEGKDGITYVALKASAAILPCGIEGTREFLHNLKRLRRTRVSVTFGPAFKFRANGERTVTHDDRSHLTHEAMYQLARLLPEQRRGYYEDLTKATTEKIEFLA